MAGKNRPVRLRVALAGIVLGAMGTVTGTTGAPTLAAGAQEPEQAASGITGLVTVQSPVVTNSFSPKEARAVCPGTKKLLGGGGWAFAVTTGHPERLALTRLEPSDDVNNTGSNAGADGYIAAAAETSPGTDDNWWLQAYAFCADAASVPGWELEQAFTPTLTEPFQRKAVGCDAADTGKTVIGTGARIASFVPGEVVLQVARASGPGDITRAQAHEDADGYDGTWWLGAYAICANVPAGYEVVTGASDEALSEPEKFASVKCPSDKRLISAGAAITDVAPGHVSLQEVFPSGRRLDAFAVENTPYPDPWDFIIARGICAYATP